MRADDYYVRRPLFSTQTPRALTPRGLRSTAASTTLSTLPACRGTTEASNSSPQRLSSQLTASVARRATLPAVAHALLSMRCAGLHLRAPESLQPVHGPALLRRPDHPCVGDGQRARRCVCFLVPAFASFRDRPTCSEQGTSRPRLGRRQRGRPRSSATSAPLTRATSSSTGPTASGTVRSHVTSPALAADSLHSHRHDGSDVPRPQPLGRRHRDGPRRASSRLPS